MLAMAMPTFLTSQTMVVLLAVLLVALVIFYWRVYRIEGRRLTPNQRRLLWALRLTVGALILLMLSRPALNMVRTRTRLPVVALVLDESTSMAFPDERDDEMIRGNAPDRRSRYDGAKKALDLLQEPLSRTHRVKVYTTSDSLRFLRDVQFRSSSRDKPEPIDKVLEGASKPTGAYSNVGDGVSDVASKLSEFKLAGVVFLSDGRVTGGTTLAELADELSRQVGGQVPVHPIVFGADHPLRDLRIDECSVPAEASLGDLLTFNLTISNYIKDNLAVDLRLFEKGKGEDASKEKEVRLRRLTWRKMTDKDPLRVTVNTIPDKEGEREFRLTLPVFEDEINTDNNEITVTVKVVKRGLRVLLVGGQPTLEYHYLVPTLLRDPVVSLSCYLQSADVDYVHQGNSGIDRLPRTSKEWDMFDVVVLADPDPKELSDQQVSGIENLVRKGGGLLVLAGRCFGLDMLLQVHPTKIDQMLPVEIDKNKHHDYAKLFPRSFKAKRTLAGQTHPVMICSPDPATNETIWGTFPSLFWRHPVVERKREAVVLLEAENPPEASDGNVLMAIRRYGEGAVFYSGVNTVWRWRYPSESYDYDRFWDRVVRYLGETRLLGAQKQVALSTDKAVYAPGEDVIITLRILDPALQEQLRNERLYVTVTGSGGQRLSVELSPDAKLPEYRGTYTAQHLGRGVIRARHVASTADSEAKPLFEVSQSFEVKLRSLEELDTSADLEGMKALADKTGGKYLDYRTVSAQTLAELASKIPVQEQVLSEPVVFEFWDTLGVLALFLVLVSAEWSLRKLWGVL